MISDYLPWLVFLAVVAAMMFFRRAGQIAPDKARELIKGGAKLIDVRSPAEFASGHISGALNVPMTELGTRVDALGLKDQPLIVYCASGTRSAMARSMLKSRCFTQVFNLGAMSRW